MKTKKQLTNRILSLVLTFMMVIGLLPMSSLTAFAQESDGCQCHIAITIECDDPAGEAMVKANGGVYAGLYSPFLWGYSEIIDPETGNNEKHMENGIIHIPYQASYPPITLFQLHPIQVDGYTVTMTEAEEGIYYPLEGSNKYPPKVTVTYTKPHTHDWKYTASGTTITATCNAEGCPSADGGSVTIAAPTDLTYNGSSKDATLSYNNWNFENPTITYNNTNRVNVTGKDITASFTVGTVTAKVDYKIKPIDITADMVSVDPESTEYNGSKITPAVTVKKGGATLVKDTDYTLSGGMSGTDVGVYTITVEGKGNYGGTAQVKWNINAKNMSGITAENITATYDGNTHSIEVKGAPKDATITYSTDGKNYSSVSPVFKNVADSGTVYYKVSLANYNEFNGSATVKINPKEIGFSWGGTQFIPYTGQLVLPEVTATGLAEGDTCEVIVAVAETTEGAGIDPGKWTAKITGLSNENYKFSENNTVPFEVKYTIYAKQTAPVLISGAESIKGKGDGYISGLTIEMEYATKRTNVDSEYTWITDPDMTFAPGTYYVRYAAKDYHYSSPYTEVTVAEGRKLTVTVPTTQTGYTLEVADTELVWNGSTTITFALADGYSKTNDFAVKVNGEKVELDANGKYVITNAQENITVTVEGVADTTAPTAEITLGTHKWNSFFNKITFGLFFKETQSVTVSAEDVNTGSGIDKVYYYLASKELTKDDAMALADWTEYKGEFSINPNNEYIIYVKAVDKAGNATYVSSEYGIVLDNIAPTIEGIENGGTYYGDKVFKAPDENFFKIEVDGNDITATEGDDEFVIKADNKEHTVTVTDGAGNITKYTIMVYKRYNVTFTDGEGGYYEKEFKYDEVITIPTNEFFEDTFRKTGYTLTEWQGYTEGMTMPLENLTFTAVYTPNNYTVEFDTNGGETIDPITVTFDEKYGTLPSSSIAGLKSGNKDWYLVDENGNVTEINIRNLTQVSTARDHKLFIKRYVLSPSVSIKLTVPGGLSDDYSYYVPGASQRVLTATVNNSNTELLSYTYQWYKDDVLIEGATESVLTLDGNVADSGTYKVEITATLKDGTGIVVTASSATGSAEKDVKIMHATNTLYYDANGGEGGPQNSFTGGTSLNVYKDEPTREHYDFIGWNTKADGSGDSYKASDAYVFTEDGGNGGCVATLYAQWKLKEYTVTYMADGEVVAELTVEHGSNADCPIVPQKDGYVGKWDRNNENITSDTVINAVYTEIDNVVPDEFKTDDKTDLEDAKKQLEDMLDDNSYTEDDKKAIEDEIKRIDEALEVIGNVEAALELIDKLPETVKKDDEAAIKAADDAYNALTDYEKSLVGKDAKKALDDAKAALAELNKPADSKSPDTGDNSNMFLWIALLLLSGGAGITLTVVDRKRKAKEN